MHPRKLSCCLKGQPRICERSPKPKEKAWSAGSAMAVTLALLVALLATVALPAGAQTLTTLWSFGRLAKNGRTPLDGLYPNGGLILDAQGNLYGTTQNGGKDENGVVFEVSPSGTETLLYRFAKASGFSPFAGLVRDASGNFYGTTKLGGAGRVGTVFKLTPSGTETVLHSFADRPGTKKKPGDGWYPNTGVIFDAQGNLYGTTPVGGNYNCDPPQGCGAVYEVTQSGNEELLYSFNGGSDGAGPSGPLVFDAGGNLYGTTAYGGSTTYCDGNGCGTVFKLTPSGWETVLYSFTGSADESYPAAGLIFDGAGNLYGTTSCYYCSSGYGTVFKLTPSGAESTFYSFTGGADGAYPDAGLIFDGAGNLYGVTSGGGIFNCRGGQGCGVIFELSPSGTETVLYSFTGGNDGAFPNGPLVFDGQGNLYGTTSDGGAYGNGTVFKLTP